MDKFKKTDPRGKDGARKATLALKRGDTKMVLTVRSLQCYLCRAKLALLGISEHWFGDF